MLAGKGKTEVAPGHRGIAAAIRAGDIDAMLSLLDNNPDLIEAKDEDGTTPLFAAVRANRGDAVEVCLEFGGDPNVRDNEGWPPVLHAGQNRGHAALQVLLEHPGTDVNATNTMRWNGLQGASMHRDYEAVRLFLRAGANLDLRNGAGMSARELLAEQPNLPEDIREAIGPNGVPFVEDPEWSAEDIEAMKRLLQGDTSGRGRRQ